jgi:FtsP/CotA-like multicopper oxidase with cupredoxin domain
VDALLLGMGERCDVLVTLQDGAFPLVALAEGKAGQGRGVVRTARGDPPGGESRPAELDGRLAAMAELNPDQRMVQAAREPDRTHRLRLSGGMMSPQWTINGRTFADAEPLPVRAGERVRLVFSNQSMMFHPMHLHGHSFQVRHEGGSGPRKDTVIVRPMQQLTVDLAADNPGQWMVHCHNSYHQEAGMMTTLSYVH